MVKSEPKKVDTNIVYEYLSNTKKKISVMQGGTRSGKTYNIILFFVIRLLQERGKTLTICRASLPSIKGSVLRDFVEILLKLGIYSEDNHNKTEQTYNLHGNLVEFVSVDQPQKIRGRRRNYLFINEANELTYDAWMQLVFRTEDMVVIDYNPSDEYSWIYDHVISRDDCEFHITTYKDNPFLPQSLVDEIERLQLADDNYWRVYGLGQRGVSQSTIYTHWEHIDKFPEGCDTWYGMDFGYNNPSSIVKIGLKDGAIYAREMLYETKLTTTDLIERLKNLEISKTAEIFADCAEPKTIEEIYRAGYNVKPSDKDVTEGIRKVKSMPLFITSDSENMIKEIRNYKWKVDKEGKTLDEPVKFMDHALDALRYGVFTRLTAKRSQFYIR